ncbi:hypothetical protein M9435_001901 [Picochlorum sp. BPE23]|nr:hypothetical protein M9435_001901 [Picochlorum sp. BPE23]
MGNCVSMAPQGIPECQRCGKRGDTEWHLMESRDKKVLWCTERIESYTLLCASCRHALVEEASRFQKERHYYSKAKTELYPKQQHKERLKRLKSDEKWEGTESFYASYRPSSAIAHLVNTTVGGGGRRGTGFPLGESQSNGNSSDVPNGNETSFDSLHNELEVSIVEEESLGDIHLIEEDEEEDRLGVVNEEEEEEERNGVT